MTVSSVDVALTNHLIDRVINMNPYQIDAIQVWQQAAKPDIFNGQILLAAPHPSGGIVMLIGEFVNDGLAAAVGVIPVGEVFYGMVEKGFSLSDILDELNKKLLFFLPEGMYLSACAIELEQEAKILYVWNGGMPDFIVADQHQEVKYRVPSSNNPLGYKDQLRPQPVFFEVTDGDRAYCYAERRNTQSEYQALSYRNKELEKLLLHKNSFDFDESSLTVANGDITVVKFMFSELNHFDAKAIIKNQQPSMSPSNWQMIFDFQVSTLRNVDIVPMMINALMQIQAPRQHKQRIYTVVTELCSNALDHGVLSLNSELKKTPNGFAEYYIQREQRLAELENGYIKVSFTHEAMNGGGKLTIDVEDSGKGFDYQQANNEQSEQLRFSGRGLNLLNQLCNKVSFLGLGNQVRVEYFWS